MPLVVHGNAGLKVTFLSRRQIKKGIDALQNYFG
jgi:hypothetical protein